MKYSLPQEIEVWYIIPAIRKELAKAMVKLGLKQREVATKLGLRESAVSQYINSKRGKDIEFNQSTRLKISNSAKKIIEKKSCVIKEIQDLLKLVKKNKTLCKVHKKHANINNCCEICLR
ncbi:helix-turn-helix domain-containing protein [Candidatus Woesearchaeota archaeon]|nr:helix-turn-helix domain-containing protein [Candidatus Woesearchaeota archaeon]MBW3022396.1 helix-turn-helix domain-containing protein [Candidatus Woesearchaeota archaeon]